MNVEARWSGIVLGEVVKGPFSHKRLRQRHASDDHRLAFNEEALEIRIIEVAPLHLPTPQPVWVWAQASRQSGTRKWTRHGNFGRVAAPALPRVRRAARAADAYFTSGICFFISHCSRCCTGGYGAVAEPVQACVFKSDLGPGGKSDLGVQGPSCRGGSPTFFWSTTPSRISLHLQVGLGSAQVRLGNAQVRLASLRPTPPRDGAPDQA